MPLLQTIPIDQDACAYLWEVTESESFLAKDVLLNAHSHARLQAMKSELHRRAFLSVRHLLALVGYTDLELYYDAMGKPHLKDGCYVSISHSFSVTALVIHKNIPVGIDVEMQRSKILKIAHKFTPFIPLAAKDISLLTHVWACKESVYKIASQAGLSFLHHIEVWPTADIFFARIPSPALGLHKERPGFDYFELRPFEVLEYAGVVGLSIAASSAREGQALKTYELAIQNKELY